jgi:hypothetical protein
LFHYVDYFFVFLRSLSLWHFVLICSRILFFYCVPFFCLGTPHHGVCGGLSHLQCSSPWCCGGASSSWSPHCVVHGVQLLVTFLIVMFMMVFNYSHHSLSWCFSLFHCGVHGIIGVCATLCCGVHDTTIIAQGLLLMFRCTWCYSNDVQMHVVVVLRCIWCYLGVVGVIWLLNYLVVCTWCFLWHTLIWHTPPSTFICFFACGVFPFPCGWYFWHALMCRFRLQLKVGAWWFLACNKFAFQANMVKMFFCFFFPF